MAKSSTYQSWLAMRRRCYDKKFKSYKNYGGRGITVCDEWQTFEGFYKNMGDKPKGKTVGRIDNNQNYCKENCRWETPMQQANNTRHNVFLTYKGETKTVAEWARALGVDYEKFRLAVRKVPEIS